MTQTQLLWHNNAVMEFLEHFKNEPVLWDPKNPNHKNKVELNDAWLRIQSAMSVELSVIDLKRKKESLMTSFRLHTRKKRADKEHRTSWFAYSFMKSFLGEIYNVDTNDEQEFLNNSTADQQYCYNSNIGRNSPASTVKRQRYETDKRKSDVIYIQKPATTSVVHSKSDKDEMDESELYGQLLAKKLRRLDQHQRDIAMHEIDNIMFRAKMNSESAQKIKSPIFIVSQPNQDQFEEESSIHYQEDPMRDE